MGVRVRIWNRVLSAIRWVHRIALGMFMGVAGDCAESESEASRDPSPKWISAAPVHGVPLSDSIETWLARDLLARCRPGERLSGPLRLVRGRDTGDDERIDLVSLTLEPSGETLQIVLTFAAAEALAEDAAAGGADLAYSPELG